MHSQRVVARSRATSAWGSGRGLLPAGGGLKEFAGRTALWARGRRVFPNAAGFPADRHGRDLEERRGGARARLPQASDIVASIRQLLYVAKERRDDGRSGCAPGPAPALTRRGRYRHRHAQDDVGQHEGGRVTLRHDYEISSRIAEVLCAGSRSWQYGRREMAARPRAAPFRRAREDAEDPERIEFMLKNGKPLRN